MKRRNRGAQSVDSQSEAQETVVASVRDHQGIATANQENEKSMKITINGTEYEYEVRYINNRAVAIGFRADLIFADLTGADLAGVDLTLANLVGADLRGAKLRGANLTLANLRGANLGLAKLRGANLTFANLTAANLRGARLTGANLRGVHGLPTVTGKPASLPEGWEYTEGKGIYRESIETAAKEA